MSKPVLTGAAALALAVTALQAHAFDFPIKIPSLGGKKPAATAPRGSAAPAAGPAAAGSKIAKMSDDEVATLALKEILGEAHQTTNLKRSSKGAPEAEGTFAYSSKADGDALRKRVDSLVEKDIGSFNGEARLAVLNRYCEERFKKFMALSGKEIDEMCGDYGRYAEGMFEHQTALRAAVKVPALAKAIKDEKVRKEFLNKFANTLGYEREEYQWRMSDDQYDKHRAVNLKEIPLEKWSFRMVRYAARWAKDNNLDADVVAKFEKAQASAPKTRCAKEPGWLYREYEGGSTYGSLKFNQNYVFPEVVDCATAKMKTDPAHIAALPKIKPLMDRTKYLAVEPEEDWRVYNNDYGQIAGKAMNVIIYFEQEY